MYYCPEKKRWREKGKEHLEEEEKPLEAPPKLGEMAAEPKKEEAPAEPKTGIDALCGTPNMHRGLIGRKPAAKSTDDAAKDGDGPPPGPSMPPIGSAFGAATQQANPFAPKGFGAPVSASALSNPNAPRGFGGSATLPTNPNAPKRDPKERRERPKQKPAPAKATPFGGLPSFMPGVKAPGPGILPPGVLPPGVKPPEPAPAAPANEDQEEEAENNDQAEKGTDFDPEGAAKEDLNLEGKSAKEDIDPEGAVKDDFDPEGSTTKLPEAPEVATEFVDPEGVAPAPPQLAESEEAEEGELCEDAPVIEQAEPTDEAKVVPPATEVSATDFDDAFDDPKPTDEVVPPAKEVSAADFDDAFNDTKPTDEVVPPATEVSAADFDDAFADMKQTDEVVPPATEVSAADFDDAFADMDTSPEKTAVVEESVAADDITEAEETFKETSPEETAVVEDSVTADNHQVEESAQENPPEAITEVAAAQEVSAPAGWDDFSIEEDVAEKEVPEAPPAKLQPEESAKAEVADDDGWGDFDDNWGDDQPDTTVVAAPSPGIEETPNVVEENVAKGDASEVAEVVTAPQEPSNSGNGESISSWVDLGDEHSALTPPEPPPNPVSEKAPSVTEEPDENHNAESAELASKDEVANTTETQADADMRKELETLKEENAKLKTVLSDRDASIAELEAAKVELTSENSRIRTEIDTLQATETNLSNELSSRAEALKFRDEEIQSLTSKLQESEARVAQPSASETTASSRVEELEADLEKARRTIADMEERLAASARSSSPSFELRSPDRTSDEFNLPDFVWNCGNSQVMEYVQKLVNDNAVLKRQATSTPPPTEESQVSRDLQAVSDNFDAKETDAEVACAFARSVCDADGHQILPLLNLLVSHGDNAQVCFEICTALENLTFTDSENRHAIVQNDGLEKILNFMEKHKDGESALIRPAVDALWNITFDDVAVDRMTESAGLLERFLSVVQTRQEAAELQAGACAVLLNLAVKEQNRWKIVQLDGVAHMAAAMKQHQQCEEVLEQGCQALYMLAYHQDLRPRVQSQCGDAATLAASCPQGARAQKWGRWLQEVLAC